jgi:hypothetical protein
MRHDQTQRWCGLVRHQQVQTPIPPLARLARRRLLWAVTLFAMVGAILQVACGRRSRRLRQPRPNTRQRDPIPAGSRGNSLNQSLRIHLTGGSGSIATFGCLIPARVIGPAPAEP